MSEFPFSEDEIRNASRRLFFTSQGLKEFQVYNTPITSQENFRLFLAHKKPLWKPIPSDFVLIIPKIIPENIARAFVFDSEVLPVEEYGGKDYFGVDWTYVPIAGGSMVMPGNPMTGDINDWKKLLQFPDFDSFDWEGSARRNAPYLYPDKVKVTWIFNGLYERLISFMDFEGAILALVDEDQEQAIHKLFDRLADMYIDLIGRFKRYYHIDMVFFHDDWGSQRAPFFSPDCCRKMILPHLKKIVNACHEMGVWFQLHSCGKNEMLVPVMIEAGVDYWAPQVMNDLVMLAEKYGDKLCFGAIPEPIPADSNETWIMESAKRFMETYGKYDCVSCHGITSVLMDYGYPRFQDEIYTIGRRLYE